MSEDGYADALPAGAVHGRGAGLNPGNRFDDRGGGGVRLHVLGEHLERMAAECPGGHQAPTTILADRTRSLINRVDSPDLSFSWSINPYRGCEHGCVYCYARPTHEALGLSCGLDFETTIVAKPDAAALLRRELGARSWRGEPIVMSGVTDAYQPIERRLRITRGCLEVMAECGQPVGIVTKSRLVTRDIDVLRPLAARGAVRVAVSITTLDPELAGSMEPRASAPRDRLRAVTALADAGIPVMVMVAPIVPGLTEHEIPSILRSAAEAGASSAGWTMLRLPHQVKAIFIDWLERTRGGRAGRVVAAIRGCRDGALNDAAFGRRMRGTGVRADGIARTFKVFAARYGLDRRPVPLSSAGFRRPSLDGQMPLWE